jgi:hypothetical protein
VSLVTDNAKLRGPADTGDIDPRLAARSFLNRAMLPAVIRAVRFTGRSSGGARTRIGSGPPVGLREQGVVSDGDVRRRRAHSEGH